MSVAPYYVNVTGVTNNMLFNRSLNSFCLLLFHLDTYTDKQSDGTRSTKTFKDGWKRIRENMRSYHNRLPWMAKLERQLAELEKILLLIPGNCALNSDI